MAKKTTAVAGDVAYVFTPPAPGEFWPGIPDRDLVAGEDFTGLREAVAAGWYSQPKLKTVIEPEAAPGEDVTLSVEPEAEAPAEPEAPEAPAEPEAEAPAEPEA